MSCFPQPGAGLETLGHVITAALWLLCIAIMLGTSAWIAIEAHKRPREEGRRTCA